MCVILIAMDEERPTPEMVDAAWDANPAGGGAGWREEDQVLWEKGCNITRMQHLAKTLPLPFILHFRVPSMGGSKPQLCHPFPVEKAAPLNLSGKTKGGVLFHNGHWAEWKKFSLDMVRGTVNRLPGGHWSDTRALAWNAAHSGLGILEMISEKVIVLTPKEIFFFGESWLKVPDSKIVASNLGFIHKMRAQGNFYHGTVPASLIGTGTALATSPGQGRDLPVVVVKGSEQAGGAAHVIPFSVALRMQEEGKISRNQLKKARHLTAQGLAFTVTTNGSVVPCEIGRRARS